MTSRSTSLARWAAVLTLVAAVLPASAIAQGFNDVFTQDGFDVWAVGDGGAVYRSLDGGGVWGSYPIGLTDLNGVAARGANVWIVGTGGAVWRSTDAGNTFASQSPAGTVDLNSVCFIDELTGWIAGNAGTLLGTTDGGVSWAAQTSGTTANLYAVRFEGGTEGWGCGGGGTVLHTTDAGADWTATTPFAFTGNLYDVGHDAGTVYVAGTNAFLGRTTNSGGSWDVVDLHIASRSDVNGVALLPGGTLWLCGGGGFLRRSTDGGGSFFFPQHPVVTGLTAVTFYDASHGWACAGKSKIVARTTDGGNRWNVPGGGAFTYTWSLKVSSGSQSVRGNTLVIDPLNRKALYCVQGRIVYKSWDIGETWSAVATIAGVGSRTNAFLVSPTDTLTWLAIVQDGDRVTRTTDGGFSWTTMLSIPFTEYGLPLDQDPNDPNTVYFGPEDGQFWKSTDFGATWFVLSDPNFRSPDDITAVFDTTGIIYVSDGVTGSGNGQIWKSSDGGLTWAVKKTVPGSEIPMIAASWLDKTIAYATDWASGGVQRTLDVGETWPNVATTTSAWGADIAKDDPYVAMYAVYSGGKSYLSTNSGLTFQEATVSGSNYGELMYDRETYLLHQSGGVYKATVNQPGMPVNNAQVLTLVAPNGGETWQYNGLESIAWTIQNIATLKLEYQPGPLDPWQLIAGSASGPPGSYGWLIPNAPTSEARIRASDAGDGAPLDVSDATFSIVVPAIATDSAALDFGTVAIGQPRSRTLRVVNDGTATLVVSSVTVASGGPFTPTRTSFSVAPNASDTLAVVFEPTAEQTYEDTLVIANNSPATPVRIPLFGSGQFAVAVPPGESATALAFDLRNNAPNPFGPDGTVIGYTLPARCDVSLIVYNALGQAVATLVREPQPAGRYAVRFPNAALGLSRGLASALPSGAYFYRLKAGDRVVTKQMVYVR